MCTYLDVSHALTVIWRLISTHKQCQRQWWAINGQWGAAVCATRGYRREYGMVVSFNIALNDNTEDGEFSCSYGIIIIIYLAENVGILSL